MKKLFSFDWDVPKNRRYLLLLLGLCGVVPHAVLGLCQIEAIAASLSPAEIESYGNFFVCQWLPFCLALISYLRLQKRDTVSLLPAILGLGVILSFLPFFPRRSVMALTGVFPLMLMMELSALLKAGEASRNRFFAGIAANRGMLRAFLFWGIALPCLAILAANASTWYIPVVSPFLTLPLPAILLADLFRQQNRSPLTLSGLLAMLLMVPASLFLVTIGPMARFQNYHLMGLGIGYGILFALLIIYNLDQWRFPRKSPREEIL